MRNKNITAEIIADSVNESGDRITSFIVVVPRIVLAEFNTHRALSRNSASSRAIPFEKMVEKCNTTPFVPIKWQKDHTGMQGTQYFTDDDYEETDNSNEFKTIDSLDYQWLQARDMAVKQATLLSKTYGVTKQVCNRLLEPFMYHTIIVTATDWENFFALRAHESAEIHIQDLAYKMLGLYNESTPKQLKAGEWHIPFGERMDMPEIGAMAETDGHGAGDAMGVYPIDIYQSYMVKIATARCARVSYLNYEGTDDYVKDLKLHDRLSSMGHWSPFEHCAQAMPNSDVKPSILSRRSGNFIGFKQYRKMFEGENKSDNRVK